MGEHLIPYLGKRYSGSVNQNLLWRDDNVYVMDNHRAAPWCWQQHLDLSTDMHSILHIDRHTDCLMAQLDQHLVHMPCLNNLSVKHYLGAKVNLAHGSANLFRWDNYLSLHIAAFRNQLQLLRSVDYGDGDDPDFALAMRPRPDELPENILYWLKSSRAPTIINIDLDFFFATDRNFTEANENYIPIYSDIFILSIFKQIKEAMDASLVSVVTICLTPSNFTPGWEECLNLSKKIFDILEVEHPPI